jgi:hypothetical protein
MLAVPLAALDTLDALVATVAVALDAGDALT